MMNIYLLSQNVNNGHDTYSSCVVIASCEQVAERIRPDGSNWSQTQRGSSSWAYSRDDVKVELIGTALPQSLEHVVCASFHAG